MFESISLLIQRMWYSLATFVLSKIICIPFIRRPFQKLAYPNHYGITNAINLRVPIDSISYLGAWFIRPCNKGITTSDRWNSIKLEDDLVNRSPELYDFDSEIDFYKTKSRKEWLDEQDLLKQNWLTNPDETVILYLHGNAETRSHRHRLELYKKFQALDLVVMAPDYRGYADSSGGFAFQTSETTMAVDAKTSYYFLKKYIHPNSKVIVWGHSLGTGVTAKLGKYTNQ